MRVSRLVEALTLVRSVSNSFPSRSPSAGPSRHCGRPPTLRTAFRVGPGPFRPGDINQFLESNRRDRFKLSSMPFQLHLGANVASMAWAAGCDERAGDLTPGNGTGSQNKSLPQQLDLAEPG
jgi:hypothetical protein